jgi:hypothetical protein
LSYHGIVDTKQSKENGSDKPSSQSPSDIPQRSRLRRTLLFAGVFALLAMLFVPTPRHGYRFVVDEAHTSIAFFQLLVNVGFAALVGAVVVNLPWHRAWFRRGAYLVAACVIVGAAWIGFSAFQRAMDEGGRSEENRALVAIRDGRFEHAKERLLEASHYWWWKGWWDGTRDAKQRAFDEQGMKDLDNIMRDITPIVAGELFWTGVVSQ